MGTNMGTNMDAFQEFLGLGKPDHIIEITKEEAMLVDHELWLTSYTQEYLDWLTLPEFQDLRKQAGLAMLRGGGILTITDDLLNLMLCVFPITFRFSNDDVGFSLKLKLYKEYLGYEESKARDKDEAEDNAGDTAQDSASTG